MTAYTLNGRHLMRFRFLTYDCAKINSQFNLIVLASVLVRDISVTMPIFLKYEREDFGLMAIPYLRKITESLVEMFWRICVLYPSLILSGDFCYVRNRGVVCILNNAPIKMI